MNRQKVLVEEELPQDMIDMFNMISSMQSDRMDSQRTELRPIPNPPKETKGASLPGLRAQQTTSTKPEDDFLEMIARVQSNRLEDQRTELPRPKPTNQAEQSEPDEEFLTQLMRAQAPRMEDQRSSIPLKEKNKGSNSKK